MIEINHLEFGYSNSKTLFRDLSLAVPSGHISGLLGKNGEGKTTLLKLLDAQLLRWEGNMNVMGEDPTKRRVSYLSDVYYLPEIITAPKGCTIHRYFKALSGFYPNFSQAIADEAMEGFGLTYDMKMDKLSQGQQKKAAISFALSLGTRLLLMDEPTNGLDIPGKSVLRRLLAKHISEDRTVIISTHQVRDLEQIIDHIIVMQDNDVVFSRTTDEIMSRLTFRAVGKGETPIYHEMTPMGKVGLFARSGEEETDTFSTELFFNAMITQGKAINALFLTEL